MPSVNEKQIMDQLAQISRAIGALAVDVAQIKSQLKGNFPSSKHRA